MTLERRGRLTSSPQLLARFLYLAAQLRWSAVSMIAYPWGCGRFAVVDTAAPGSGAGHERTRSAEDVREHVQRLRSLPVDQVMGDVLFSLLNAAQVKLGRRDARLLIDVSTVALDHVRAYLPGELTTQIDQMLGQLRLGQVSAEGHAGQRGEPEDNDLDRVPPPPSAGPARSPAGRGSSKLWVPGR
jgi:hypothetical protein